MTQAKQLRLASGLSLIKVAVAAGVAEGTARLYEANPDAVNERSRSKLDRYYSTTFANRSGIGQRSAESSAPRARA